MQGVILAVKFDGVFLGVGQPWGDGLAHAQGQFVVHRVVVRPLSSRSCLQAFVDPTENQIYESSERWDIIVLRSPLFLTCSRRRFWTLN